MTSKEKYLLLDKLKLCHRCEKKSPAPNRKFCFDCLDKIAKYNAVHYDSERAKEYQSRRRELYREKKEKGICVKCSKIATHGMYCYECSIKAKRHNQKTAERRKRERHERGLIPELRKNTGLCLRCGQSLNIEKSQFCSKCCEENRKNSTLADKSKWRKAEQIRYETVRQRRRKCYDKNNI